MESTCENCEWFHGFAIGECHLNPPRNDKWVEVYRTDEGCSYHSDYDYVRLKRDIFLRLLIAGASSSEIMYKTNLFAEIGLEL
jgi:hypothetical protein